VRPRSKTLRVSAYRKNVLGRTWKVVFEDKIVLRFRKGDALGPGAPCWDRIYKFRVIEVLRDCWLWWVTKHYFGKGLSTYDPRTIYLLSKAHAEWFGKHAVYGPNYDQALPDLHRRGNVPSNYSEFPFNPDRIYPHQRFFMLEPSNDRVYTFTDAKTITASKPKPGYIKKVWMGVGEAHSGDFVFFGAYNWNAKVINLGDPWPKNRWANLMASGYKIGAGLGGSVGLVAVLGHGFDEANDMNIVQAPAGWSDFDYDVALVTKLSAWLKGLKGIGKVVDTLQKYKKLSKSADFIYKNWKIYRRGIYTIPIPGAGTGAHLWGGWKAGEVEVTAQGKG